MPSFPNFCFELVNKIRYLYPAQHELKLQFDRLCLEIRANKTQIIQELSAYYHRFLSDPACSPDLVISVHQGGAPHTDCPFLPKTPDPGKSKIKEEYADLSDGRLVRKRLTGMLFAFGPGLNLAIGPCLENLNQIVNFINNRFIEFRLHQGALLAHAAGVKLDQRGLAIAGFSGKGKSTLALQLLSRGFDFVSNDRLLINRNNSHLYMQGVAKLPRINPGTALHNPDLSILLSNREKNELSLLSPEELWEYEHKYDVPLDQCFSQCNFELTALMRGLIILNWKYNKNEDVHIQEVNINKRQDLLSAFMKNPGLFFWSEQEKQKCFATEDYIKVLQHCPVFEISGGVDFNRASYLCQHLLSELTTWA